MQIDIRESKERDVVLLEIEGHIDDRAGREIERKVASSLEAGARAFVIDVRGVDLPTGGGIRALLTMANRIDKHDGRLILCGLQSPFRTVLDVSGFGHYFRTADTKRDAVAQLSAQKLARQQEPSAQRVGGGAPTQQEESSLCSLVHRILTPAEARSSAPRRMSREARESKLAAVVGGLIHRSER